MPFASLTIRLKAHHIPVCALSLLIARSGVASFLSSRFPQIRKTSSAPTGEHHGKHYDEQSYTGDTDF